ncbi:MAG: hypothetical protein IT308_06130 [Anaerolineaceae bacterium]|nr:hypothetical protein [Anaerolineaceae bacterium]
MWNVPYLFAFVSPIVHRVSLYQALLMQSIGLIGESIILATLPTEYQNIRYTAFRFILFDSIGLLTLLIAAWLTRLPRSLKKT